LSASDIGVYWSDLFNLLMMIIATSLARDGIVPLPRCDRSRRSQSKDDTMLQKIETSRKSPSRRSVLRSGLAAPAVVGTALLGGSSSAGAFGNGITFGDVAILRFLAALEIIEADLWEQYNEIYGIQDGEVLGGSGNPTFAAALAQLDQDMSQYVHDNTEDEVSHFMFLNAYLESKGARPVDLGPFRKLAGSSAPGSSGKSRITNLTQLTIDTSWWTRYRSFAANPDLGGKFAPVIPGLLNGQFPAIPRNSGDLSQGGDHVQAIANTAAFHFGTIEQGGSSLYPQLAQRVTSAEVLRILLSIGPTETMHFQTWSDKAGNTIEVTDPTNGLAFPNPKSLDGNENLQTNLIMPEPTVFLSSSFPVCSIIRPTETDDAATRAFASLKDSGLFINQSDSFFATMHDLAAKADRARRGEQGDRD
jgi:hypothetical protein